MEVRLLRSFLAVAREQNISRAARAIHITQPSLSRQIMDLEESLGVTLFHRGRRAMTLTDQGVLLRRRAEQILDLVSRTEDELATGEAVGGTVHIGAGETQAFRFLTGAISVLVKDHPAISFNIRSAIAEDVMERLDRGLLDFGLLIEPADITRYDCLRLPVADVWGVLPRSDSPLAARESVRPGGLRDEPLRCSRQALEGGQLPSWLKVGQGRPNVVATCSLIFNASLLAEAGVGHGLGLDGIIATAGNGGLCFRPLDPPLVSHVDLVWKKRETLSRPCELFLESVRRAAAARETIPGTVRTP